MSSSEVPTVEILGVEVARLGRTAALREIARLYDEEPPALVAYANAHTLNLASRETGYRATLDRAAIVLNDGSGVSIAARFRRKPFPENLNGSDLNPAILELAARNGWSVYLLGARPGVAEKAAAALAERIPGLSIVGTRDGYFPAPENDAVVRAIEESGAGVLMVAMGNPAQETWLDQNLAATGARLGVGVGAFFDFAAGEVPRAPSWMNRIGIEWIYRLMQEPKRMWRRYILGNPAFLWRAWRSAKRER
jgi:exopolysaccharide biosynthesis WecB/TagA/CpsF family protein